MNPSGEGGSDLRAGLISRREKDRLQALTQTLLKHKPADQVTRLYIALSITIVLYALLYLFAPRNLFRLVASAVLTFLISATYVALLRLNASITATLKVLRRPKTILVLGLLALYTYASNVEPVHGIYTRLDTAAFSVIYLSVLFLDAMIDRHRWIVTLLVTIMVGATARMIYSLSYLDSDLGIVLFRIFGRPIFKRRISRSAVVSLLLQMLEGTIFIIQTFISPNTASLHSHFIFIRQLPRFAVTCTNPMPPISVQKRVRLALLSTPFVILFGAVGYFLSFLFEPGPVAWWLNFINFLTVFGLIVTGAASLYKNVSTSVAKALFKQTNIWIIAVLTIIYIPTSAIEPTHPISSVLYSLILVIGFLCFVVTDAILVTNTHVVAILGVLGMVTMISSFIDHTVFARGEEITVLTYGHAQITKLDVSLTVFSNYILFFAEAVVAALYYRKRKERHCNFVRCLRLRGTVLLSEFVTPEVSHYGLTLGGAPSSANATELVNIPMRSRSPTDSQEIARTPT
eukprot:c47056_g1_i1.p1 GENE.c47056_g1_i1~~c47056_g1_i1.p1  ORF type:complete len:524 (+),score=87.17 c47056_g1_i1:26-1573(+)